MYDEEKLDSEIIKGLILQARQYCYCEKGGSSHDTHKKAEILYSTHRENNSCLAMKILYFMTNFDYIFKTISHFVHIFLPFLA